MSSASSFIITRINATGVATNKNNLNLHFVKRESVLFVLVVVVLGVLCTVSACVVYQIYSLKFSIFLHSAGLYVFENFLMLIHDE